MKTMKQVTRYQCGFCKKDFKTPDRHYCKFNPILKNCFTCKHLKGWHEGYAYDGGCEFPDYEPPHPDCTADEPNWGDWDIESIKSINYDMQCCKWEEGKFDWSKER